MKHVDMLPLMGKVVTVCTELKRNCKEEWKPQQVPQWVGWIVGFTFKLDGETEWLGSGEGSNFIETSRQLCVMVQSWPTTKPRFVTLDGYTLGGTPESPDWGGWRAYRKHQASTETEDES